MTKYEIRLTHDAYGPSLHIVQCRTDKEARSAAREYLKSAGYGWRCTLWCAAWGYTTEKITR